MNVALIYNLPSLGIDSITWNEKGGKRGFRVYPPWDVAMNKQAIQSQKWQLPYFFEIVFGEKPHVPLLEKLLLARF